MKIRCVTLVLITVVATLSFLPLAHAEYSVSRSVIGNGGGEMGGGSYVLMATLGQAAAGDDGGFWSPLPEIEVWPEFWPDSPEVVFEGDAATTHLHIVNVGSDDLYFTVSATEGGALDCDGTALTSDGAWPDGEIKRPPPPLVAAAGINMYGWDATQWQAIEPTETDVDWLSFNPEAGVISPGDTVAVAVALDGASLTPGWYFATAQVESNDPNEPLTELPLLVVVPQYRFDHHDAGNVVFCITDGGCFGYWDQILYHRFGDGFQYPATDPEDYLACGSFWAGTGPARMMDGSCDYDWKTEENGELVINEGPPETGTAKFDDSGAPVPLGLSVFQESVARADPPYDDYVVLTFGVANTSDGDIRGLYLGLFMDWDVCRTDTLDTGGFDDDLSLGYQYDSTEGDDTFVGVTLLTPCPPAVPSSFRFVHNPTYVWPGAGHIPDADKYDFVSSGIIDDTPDHPSDWSTVMSIGPIDLPAGDSTSVSFALVVGTGLEDLRANTTSARLGFGLADVPGLGESRRPQWALGQSYPNPANPTTTIRFGIAERAYVRVAIFDITGRLVRTLVDGQMQAGSHKATWDGMNNRGRRVPSGVFFCRLRAGEFKDSCKIIVVR